jgi:transposase-like protein
MSRPIGTPAELERRRHRAVDLMDQGESPTVIAHILGVNRPSLYRWRQADRSRPDGLAAKPHPGPTPLANFAAADTLDLRQHVQAALAWLKEHAYFLYAFIEHTNLPLLL